MNRVKVLLINFKRKKKTESGCVFSPTPSKSFLFAGGGWESCPNVLSDFC